MRTWILCADKLCAKLFMKKSPQDEACLCRTISCPKTSKNSHQKKELSEFAHYVAEEIEIACGAGTDSRLVLLFVVIFCYALLWSTVLTF